MFTHLLHASSQRVLTLLTLLCLTAATASLRAGRETRFLVNYSSQVGSIAGFDQVILDPYAKFLPQDEAPTTFAYLSLVEIAQGARYEQEARRLGLVLDTPLSETWSSSFADLSNPAWTSFFLQSLAAHADKAGFDGFFLDTADSVARLPGAQDPAKLAAYHRQLATLIAKLHETYPTKPIILNRGFPLLDLLPANTISSVLIESVFQTYDFKSKTYLPSAATDTALLVEKIKSLRKAGLEVHVLDYVDPTNPALAQKTAEQIAALDAAALITTPDLQGTVLAPNSLVARKILVLYGYDPELTGQHQIWPSDTEVARQFQAPLEWMGYELHYHAATSDTLPVISDHEFAGIILDTGIALPMDRELRYANWLIDQKKRGMKLLICGTYPFQSSPARQKMFAALGVHQISDGFLAPQNVRIVHQNDQLLGFEREVTARASGFLDAQAPKEASSHLTLLCEDRAGRTRRFDPIYNAPWGGVILHPYWNFQPSFNDSFAYADPFAFLQMTFPAGAFPAPDATTRDGLRLLWSHIDGDGFVTLSNVKRNTTCAEIIRDHILTKYPIPTTVSVIEAEIRALQSAQDPETTAASTALAREIFELPYIEAASHAYSHPFVWSDLDTSPHDKYDHKCLLLRHEHAFEKVDAHREVVGSVEYIERELLPPGKKVKLMLWSGNCRPFPEALRYCRDLGIENINGGFTVLSKRHPQLSAVAPRSTWWDDELQIYAGNQNDYVYTNDWTGPTYGGFEQVIDSFIRLDEGHRMKGVNIYYHFYSGAHYGSLTALERIHDWAVAQPLHAVTASEAASLTRGAVHSVLHQTGPKRWLLTNHGSLSTFRIPQSLGYPDLAASTNILGYNDHLGERYIATNGQPFVELVLADTPQPHIFLQTSEAVITFSSLLPDRATFEISTLRPAPLSFGGLAPKSEWSVAFADENGQASSLITIADDQGRIRFTLPQSTKVSLALAHSTASR